MSDEIELASLDELFTPSGRRYITIQLPISQRYVRIQSLFEHEKEAYEGRMLSAKGGLSLAKVKEARRQLIVEVLVDKAGNRLMQNGHISKLSTMDGKDIAAIYEAAMDHCGFKNDEIENLVKNSGSVRADS